jgi:hypothetical protein
MVLSPKGTDIRIVNIHATAMPVKPKIYIVAAQRFAELTISRFCWTCHIGCGKVARYLTLCEMGRIFDLREVIAMIV